MFLGFRLLDVWDLVCSLTFWEVQELLENPLCPPRGLKWLTKSHRDERVFSTNPSLSVLLFIVPHTPLSSFLDCEVKGSSQVRLSIDSCEQLISEKESPAICFPWLWVEKERFVLVIDSKLQPRATAPHKMAPWKKEGENKASGANVPVVCPVGRFWDQSLRAGWFPWDYLSWIIQCPPSALKWIV